MVRQFKELERRELNQPDDKVEVTARFDQTTEHGLVEKGGTFEMPARAARIAQNAGFVEVGSGELGEEQTVRVEAYNSYWDTQSAVKKAAREAAEKASKENGMDLPEEVVGQAGLAQADSGDPRMFSGSQGEAEAKLKAQADSGDRKASAKAGQANPAVETGKSKSKNKSSSQKQSEDQKKDS